MAEQNRSSENGNGELRECLGVGCHEKIPDSERFCERCKRKKDNHHSSKRVKVSIVR